MKFKHFRRLLEFFIIGIVFGITEDLLAVVFATDAQINLKVFMIVVLVALPFAIISELVVDKIQFKDLRVWWNKRYSSIKKLKKK